MKKLRELNVLDLYGDIFSFMVAYNILKIGYNYNISKEDTYRACSMAIVHDCPEMFTSDIPHDCKVKHPELREMLSVIEHEFITEEMPELKDLYDEYAEGKSLVCTLVELGDAISVLQYVNREIVHGNKHEDMQVIKNEVSLRIVKLFELLDIKLLDKKIKEENNGR